MAHMTESSFSRTFRRIHGRSFRSLQIEVKMKVAGCLLQHTDLDVSEISAFLGYAEVNKFQQAFRRFHRTSPTVFRSSKRRKARTFTLKIDGGVLQADCKLVLDSLRPSESPIEILEFCDLQHLG